MADREMEKGTEEIRGFCCQYCDRIFTNKQALGGHQNSHRKERASIKKAKANVPFFPALSGMNFSKSLAHASRTKGPTSNEDTLCSDEERYELRYAIFLPAPAADFEGETSSQAEEAAAAAAAATNLTIPYEECGEEDVDDDIDLTLHL